MAMPTRFEVRPEVAFPKGLFAVGQAEQAKDWDRSTREQFVQMEDWNKSTGEGTGFPVWTVDVIDPDPATNKHTRSFSLRVISKTEPKVPEVPAGMLGVPIEVEGLTATAYVAGASETSRGRMAWSYRCTGVRPVSAKSAVKEAA